MDQALKQRLVGAVVLIALAVIFLPVFISGPQDADQAAQQRQIIVPPGPDSRLSSKRLPVIEDGAQISTQSQTDAQQWPLTDFQNDSTVADAADNSGVDGNDTDGIDGDVSGASEPVSADPAAADTAAATTSAATNTSTNTSTPAMADEPAQTVTEAAATVLSADIQSATAEPDAGVIDAQSWRVQVASLGNPDNATRLQQQLQSLSLNSATERVTSAGVQLYRISVGPFADQDSAQQALQKIRSSDARLRPVLLAPEGANADSKAVQPGADENAPATASGSASTADSATSGAAGLDRYAVQVGVFSAKKRAEQVVERLQNAGFAAYYETIERAGETLFRVRIGPLLSEQDGNNIAAKILRDLDLKSMVVDYP
jgi:DedD protein